MRKTYTIEEQRYLMAVLNDMGDETISYGDLTDDSESESEPEWEETAVPLQKSIIVDSDHKNEKIMDSPVAALKPSEREQIAPNSKPEEKEEEETVSETQGGEEKEVDTSAQIIEEDSLPSEEHVASHQGLQIEEDEAFASPLNGTSEEQSDPSGSEEVAAFEQIEPHVAMETTDTVQESEKQQDDEQESDKEVSKSNDCRVREPGDDNHSAESALQSPAENEAEQDTIALVETKEEDSIQGSKDIADPLVEEENEPISEEDATDVDDITMPIYDEIYLEEEDKTAVAGRTVVTSPLQMEDLMSLQDRAGAIDPHVQEANQIFVSHFKTLHRHKFEYKQIGIDGFTVNSRHSTLGIPFQKQAFRLSVGSLQSHTLEIPELDADEYSDGFDDTESMTSPHMISPRMTTPRFKNSMENIPSPAMHRILSGKRRANSTSTTPDHHFDISPNNTISGGSLRSKGTLSKRVHLKSSTTRGRSLAGIFKKDNLSSTAGSHQMDDDDRTENDAVDDDMLNELDYMTKFHKSKEHLERIVTPSPDQPANMEPPSRRLLSVYRPDYHWVDVAEKLCSRRDEYHFNTIHPLRFTMAPKSLTFEHHFTEPLFGRVAIYDTAQQHKVTEDFHFFASDGETLKMLPEKISEEISNAKNKCLFSISEPTSSMYFILYVDRVVTNHLDDAIKFHTRDLRKKEEKKIVSNFTKNLIRLGYFRQPFLWGFAPVFQGKSLLADNRVIQPLYSIKGSNGNLLNISEIIESGFYATKKMKQQYAIVQATFSYDVVSLSQREYVDMRETAEDFAEFPMSLPLHSRHSQRGSKRHSWGQNSSTFDMYDNDLTDTMTGISSGCLSASPTNDLLAQSLIDNDHWGAYEPRTSEADMKWSITSESEAYGVDRKYSSESQFDSEGSHRPSFSRISIDEDALAFECHTVCEFPASIVRTPYLKYVNSLFVSPRLVNFQTLSKVRNITVEVMFRSDDSDIDNLNGEQRVASRYDSTIRHRVACTSIQFHEKSPQYFDEIKIDLPPMPHPKDHLFFTFYNVRVEENDSPKQKGNSPMREEYGAAELSVLGYAFLPLYQGDYIAQDRVYELSIMKELKPFYLQPEMDGLLDTAVKTKFEVSTSLVSTVYPKDTRVRDFFAVSRDVLSETPNTPQLDEKLKSLSNSVEGLQMASHSRLLPHLPVILNMLFNLLSFCPHFTSDEALVSHIGTTIFNSLLTLLRGASSVNREYARGNGVLSTYVQHLFDDAIGGVPIFSTLPKIFNEHIQSSNTGRHSVMFAQGNAIKLLERDSLTSSMRLKGSKTLSRKSTAKNTGTLKRKTKNVSSGSSSIDAQLDGEREKDRSANQSISLQFSWLLFDLIIKSLALHADDKMLREDQQHTQDHSTQGAEHEDGWLFPEELQPHLESFRTNFFNLIKTITKQILKFTNSNTVKNNSIARLANRHLALFMRDLIPILKRSHFVELLAAYMEETMSNDIKTLRLKVEFFQILIDYRDFLPVNHVKRAFGNRIARFFLEVVMEAITRSEDRVDEKAVMLLLQHLTKIDFDSRYQEDQRKELIAEIYLPFVDHLLSVADFNTLPILQKETMLQNILICVLWILRNLKKHKLAEWCAHKRTDTIVRLFTFFERAVITFSVSETAPDNVKTQVMLNLLHVVDTCVKQLKPLIENIKSGNVDIDHLPLEDQQLFLRGHEIDIAASSSKSAKPQNTYVFTVMESLCQFFHSLVLCCRFHDLQICIMVFDSALRQFLELFIGDIVVDFEAKMSRTEIKKYERKWRLLVGAVFAYVEHPSADLTHPAIITCLRILTNPFYKPEDHNITVKPDPENLVYSEDNLIKAASLDNLIERLIVGARDKERYFSKVFLLTYYSFSKPSELIRELIGYYHSHGEDSVRLKLLNFLGDWVKKSFHDFTNYTIAAVMHFLDDPHLITNHKTTQQKVKRYLLKELFHIKTQNVNVLEPPPPSEVPASFSIREMAQPKIPLDHLSSPKTKRRMFGSNPFDYPFELLDWPSVEIARQMTLIESELFKHIEPKECFGLAWSKKDKKDQAPNIVAISERFNKVNAWVQKMILLEQELKKRQALLMKFWDIVKELRKLNNFVSINQICSAINSAAVFRLKKTKEVLGRNDLKLFQEYSSLFDNPPYKELRHELQMAMPNPAVPFIGMYLTELTFIEDGNHNLVRHPTKPDMELINYTKRRLYSDTILNIQLYQQTPYNFTKLPYLHYILTDEIFQDPMTEKKMYELSLKYEKRQKR